MGAGLYGLQASTHDLGPRLPSSLMLHVCMFAGSSSTVQYSVLTQK